MNWIDEQHGCALNSGTGVVWLSYGRIYEVTFLKWLRLIESKGVAEQESRTKGWGEGPKALNFFGTRV
jgi:hypothetical protein